VHAEHALRRVVQLEHPAALQHDDAVRGVVDDCGQSLLFLFELRARHRELPAVGQELLHGARHRADFVVPLDRNARW
jgi:hypothetical protein